MHIHRWIFLIPLAGLLVFACHSNDTDQGKASAGDTTTATTITRQHPIDSVLTYTARDLRQVENRATLSLQYTWSAEQTGDPHKAFYFPRDMAIAPNGDFYVLDTGNNQVQVFDSTRTYLRTLGKKGNGPGEFQMPQAILLLPGNRLLVSQPFQKRVQILSREGQYLNGFTTKGHLERIRLFQGEHLIAPDTRRAGNPNHHLFLILDFQGDSLGWLGTHKYSSDSPAYALEGVISAKDADENLYAGYYIEEHIEEYTPAGKLLQSIQYTLPAHLAETTRTLYDLTSGNGNLYALVPNRLKTKSEQYIGGTITRSGPGRSGARITYYLPNPDIKSEKTDLYRLLIFDRWGRLVSSNVLNVYASKIQVYHRKLYVIDSFVGMKIYEYAIHLPAESSQESSAQVPY